MSDPAGAADLRIVAGSPTDEETAALAAVLTEVALEQAASTLPLADEQAASGWSRSARGLREPLQRGTWR